MAHHELTNPTDEKVDALSDTETMMAFIAQHSSEVLMRLDDVESEVKKFREAWTLIEHKFAEMDRLVDESIDRRDVRKKKERKDKWIARVVFLGDKIKWVPKYMVTSVVTLGLFALFFV